MVPAQGRCSAAAGMAGALARPAWLALPLVPDWRWLLGRDDSPWYPTVRLFRQTALDRWDDVFERMAAALPPLKSPGDATPLTV